MEASDEAGGEVQAEPMGMATFLITSEVKYMMEDSRGGTSTIDEDEKGTMTRHASKGSQDEPRELRKRESRIVRYRE
eukprot:scaffold16650_cov38-Cyclotella_meneghiniana.AAC.7